ncbi:MAG: hypothetical protein AAGA54_06245 [Myxococcota bacterium]
MRARLALGCLCIGGCFTDPLPVPGDGSTSQSGTTEGGDETLADASSTTADVEDTTGTFGSTTGTTGSTGTSGTDTMDPCPPGALGCPCDRGACEPLLQCIEGQCVEAPSMCVVSYGGTATTIEVQVTRVLSGGGLVTGPIAMETSSHDIDDDTAGQDMLLECGGTIYAAAVTEGAVYSYGLDDGVLEPLAITPLDREPRALECVRPGADHLVVFSAGSDKLNSSLAVQSFARDDAGGLSPLGAPLEIASLPGPIPPRRVRTAWGPDTSTAYAIYDNVQGNSSTLAAVSIDAGSGMIEASGISGETIDGIQAQLGGLDYEPPSSQLVLTGGQVGDPTGAGNFVRFGTNGGIPSTTFVDLPDAAGSAFFEDSTSVKLAEVGTFGPVALVGSADAIGVVTLMQAEPVLETTTPLVAGGEVTALSAFDGSIVVVVDGERVRTLDAFQISEDRDSILEAVDHELPGYTTSVLARCDATP